LLDCKNCEYCYDCYGLRNQKYCIKNKQYSKEEYFEELQKQDNSKSIDDFFQENKKNIVSYMHGE